MTKRWAVCAAISSMAVSLTVSCQKTDDTPTPPQTTVSIPALSEVLGGWEATGYRWDLNEGKSACYLMDETGNDFAYDKDGNYITVTVKEYCEQYAADYNADPKNTVKGTAEDFAEHAYEGTYMFTNFNVTSDKVIVYGGQRIPNAGTMAVLVVTGTYTYDAITGIFTVDDVAIENDPRSLAIKVWKETDSEGVETMYFRYADYDMYLTPTYDQTKKYYVYAPTIYYTYPADPYVAGE